MALAGVDRGTGSSNTPSTSTTASPTGLISKGSRAVLCLALDNSGTGGDDPSGGYQACTDNAAPLGMGGNTWQRLSQSLKTGGVVNDGVSLVMFECLVVFPIRTNTTITVGHGGSVTNRAWTLTEVTAAADKIPMPLYFHVASGGGTTGTSTTPSITTGVSAQVGQLVIGCMGAEQGDGTITGDADATNGSWSTQQKTQVGSGATGMEVASQYKVQTTTTSTQTYNTTITSSDWACAYIVYAEADLDCQLRGSGGTTSGGTSFTVSPLLKLRARSMAVLCMATDNAGSGGAGATNDGGVTDTKGHTWHRFQQTQGGGGVNLGTCASMFFTHLEYDLDPTDVITVTLSATVPARVHVLYEVIPASDKNIIAVTQAWTAAGNATTTPTSTTPQSCAVGELNLAIVAHEHNSAVTYDTDTTGGVWSPGSVVNVGTTTSGQQLVSQYKLTTATGTQTYNLTVTASDWAPVHLVLRAAPLAANLVGGNSSAAAGTTLNVTTPYPYQRGMRLFCCVAADNSAASGLDAAGARAVTDTKGNTWRLVSRLNRTAASAANDGVWIGVYTTLVQYPYTTSDSTTITFSQSTTAKSALIWGVKCAPGYVPSWIAISAAATASTTPSVGTFAATTPSVGDMLFGVMGAEHVAAVTGSVDTTGGNWYNITLANAGTTTSGVEVHVGYKSINAAGTTPTFAQTITSTDWASLLFVLKAVPVHAEVRGTVSNNSAGTTWTLTDPINEDMPVDSYLVMGISCDNSGTSGATPITATSVTDANGNVWNRVAQQNATAGVANDGLTSVLFWAKMTNPITSTTDITVTLSASTTNKVATFWAVYAAPGYTVRNMGGDSNSGSGTTTSVASSMTLADGDVVIAHHGSEFGTAPSAADSDTTNGNWFHTNIVHTAAIGAASAAGMSCLGQHKYVLATGTQTANATVSSSDWASVLMALRQESNNVTRHQVGIQT